MTKDEALRYLYYAAKMKEVLTVTRVTEHNVKVVEAVNILAEALGINFAPTLKSKMASSPPNEEQDMDIYKFEEIYEEAEKRLRKHNSGVRGQTVTARDGIEYWCAVVAEERALNSPPQSEDQK